METRTTQKAIFNVSESSLPELPARRVAGGAGHTGTAVIHHGRPIGIHNCKKKEGVILVAVSFAG